MKQVFNFFCLPNYERGDYQNYFVGDNPQNDEELRQELSSFFLPHNRKLYSFLGRQLNWEY